MVVTFAVVTGDDVVILVLVVKSLIGAALVVEPVSGERLEVDEATVGVFEPLGTTGESG